MDYIIAKGINKKNVEITLKGNSVEVHKVMDAADGQFVIKDQFGGIYVHKANTSELLIVIEPFELRCNAQLDNKEIMKIFEKTYMDIKEKAKSI